MSDIFYHMCTDCTISYINDKFRWRYKHYIFLNENLLLCHLFFWHNSFEKNFFRVTYTYCVLEPNLFTNFNVRVCNSEKLSLSTPSQHSIIWSINDYLYLHFITIQFWSSIGRSSNCVWGLYYGRLCVPMMD